MSPSPRPAPSFSPRPHLLPLLLTILLLPMGCAKVQPEPFAKFAEGVELAKVTMDKTAADYSAQYRLRYVREQSGNLK